MLTTRLQVCFNVSKLFSGGKVSSKLPCQGASGHARVMKKKEYVFMHVNMIACLLCICLYYFVYFCSSFIWLTS